MQNLKTNPQSCMSLLHWSVRNVTRTSLHSEMVSATRNAKQTAIVTLFGALRGKSASITSLMLSLDPDTDLCVQTTSWQSIEIYQVQWFAKLGSMEPQGWVSFWGVLIWPLPIPDSWHDALRAWHHLHKLITPYLWPWYLCRAARSSIRRLSHSWHRLEDASGELRLARHTVIKESILGVDIALCRLAVIVRNNAKFLFRGCYTCFQN